MTNLVTTKITLELRPLCHDCGVPIGHYHFKECDCNHCRICGTQTAFGGCECGSNLSELYIGLMYPAETILAMYNDWYRDHMPDINRATIYIQNHFKVIKET